jgi:hypothetical protein
VLLIGIGAFLVLTAIGALSGDSTALSILGLIGSLAAGLMLLLSLPSIVAGIGLLKFQEWARILATVVGCISLFDIPFGTALGIYTLITLFDDETIGLFKTHQINVTSAPSV